MARRRKRKGTRRTKTARRRRKSSAARKSKGKIPLPILVRRAKKLVKIVRSRGGAV